MQDTSNGLFVCTYCGDGVHPGTGTRLPGTITIVHTLCLEADLED